LAAEHRHAGGQLGVLGPAPGTSLCTSRLRYKHAGADEGQAAVKICSKHWTRVSAEGGWTHAVCAKLNSAHGEYSSITPLLISLPLWSSVLTEHGKMLKMGLFAGLCGPIIRAEQ